MICNGLKLIGCASRKRGRLKIKNFNETHMLGQVLPGPVPGPDPDCLLRDDHGGVAQVARARLRGLEEGEAAEADVRRAHLAFVLFQRGRGLKR